MHLFFFFFLESGHSFRFGRRKKFGREEKWTNGMNEKEGKERREEEDEIDKKEGERRMGGVWERRQRE